MDDTPAAGCKRFSDAYGVDGCSRRHTDGGCVRRTEISTLTAGGQNRRYGGAPRLSDPREAADRNDIRRETTVKQPLLDMLFTAADFARAANALRAGRGPVAAFGLPEAHKSHIAAALAAGAYPNGSGAAVRTVLLVTTTDTTAVRMRADVEALGVPAALLLPREIPLTHVLNISGERAGERVRALMQLSSGEGGVVVASMGALLQHVAPKQAFLQQRIRLATGDDVQPRALIERFVEAGYERVAMVEGRGQVALRGGIVDVYATDARYPVRMEFWGDTIDQMRSFDPVTQRSIEQVTRTVFAPAFETPQTQAAVARALKRIEGREEFADQYAAWREGHACAGADALLPLLYKKLDTVVDYLPPDALILADEPHRLEEAARAAQIAFAENVAAMLERGEGLPQQGNLQQSAEAALQSLSTPRTMALYTLARSHPLFQAGEIVQSLGRSAPQYMGSFDELARDIGLWKRTREAAVLFTGEHAGRLQQQLQDLGAETAQSDALTRPPVAGEALIVAQQLPRGFCYPELHLTVLGEQELFGKAAAPVKHGKKRGAPKLSELAVGDYVVHEAYGVGRFVGVETLTVQDNTRDYLLLEYRGGDRLYIPTDQMDRVQKYIGGGDEETVPHLSKLGGSDWQGRVNRARESAKKLAVDLAALYASRMGNKGFAFSPDSPWQVQMEERFPYRETPDQLESIREIKADMERPRPMDRLLCGDVGYGKTEVALRAAFKAVQDSKQVAFLVPTTILAQQHYNTLSARFADFPVRTACLSRFTPPLERKAIKEKLQKGLIDVVVGTHALLAKDVRFKDLGLIIIDEEQRFGVNHKEKLKELKREVDVLTLTATPIPRTLNMSMTGVRDISVIETPPESRYPVQTFVLEYTDALVVDAITRELARGGQAYIVYNRVQSMETYVRRLSELLPEVRFAMGHGQMPEGQLEKTMLAFLEHETDVLVCSTIIESGLDIPNVNTMIVIDADRFGLSQLYQLRGRVGRSTRIGYAYLTVRRGVAMSEEAHKRLMAIREFTQFGAGFRLAMRDLEIRGAGSLLGAEQHGHIADIGYEYYCKLMRQAVAEAKGEQVLPETDIAVDIPVSAHIPKDYIPSEVQRLSAYRRIADAADDDALYDVREELEDRYGELPAPVENMLSLASIRCGAARAQLSAVTAREGEAVLAFREDAQLDGARLIAAVSGMRGAQLTASAPPSIRIRQKDAAVKTWMKQLPQFIYTIVSCVDTMDRL